MLTNFYYYDHYRPYIFKTKSIIEPGYANAALACENDEDARDKGFLLNCAYKADVIEYMKETSGTVNGFRNNLAELVKQAGHDMLPDEYNGAALKEYLINELDNFVIAVNITIAFTQNQNVSKYLSRFGKFISDALKSDREALSRLGISVDDDGVCALSAEKASRQKTVCILSGIRDAGSLFTNLYNGTADLMSRPLTQHMNYKNLNYYYNYKFGSFATDNTFNIIDLGMLYDRAV